MSTRSRTQARPSGATHGVLVLDKPAQMTSHDVVNRVRHAFGTRRVGHAGTLDPMATGVLVLLLGEATKLSNVLTTEKKTYEARVQFGTSTDSGDADGKVKKTMQLPSDWLDEQRLALALEGERIRRLQVPPQVSAIKVDGQRAYSLARKGQHVHLDARDVIVHELAVLDRGPFHLDISLCVSKGYYVRALAHDLGSQLGVPAHLSQLRRTQSGPFALSEAHRLPLTGTEPLVSVHDAARRSLPLLAVTPEGAERVRQGKRLGHDHLLSGPPDKNAPVFAAVDGHAMIALVEPCDNSEFRVKRGINLPPPVASILPSGDSGG